MLQYPGKACAGGRALVKKRWLQHGCLGHVQLDCLRVLSVLLVVALLCARLFLGLDEHEHAVLLMCRALAEVHAEAVRTVSSEQDGAKPSHCSLTCLRVGCRL